MERGVFVILVLSGLCHFALSLLHHYHLINEPKTWLEARQYCREKHTDLATVNDEQDLEELAGLSDSVVSHIFLGLYRSWGWSLSDSDDYKEGELAYWNWGGGEKEQNYCGTIGGNGAWLTRKCDRSLKFFCYNASNTDLSERFSFGEGSRDWLSAQAYCRERHTDLARVRNQLENEELRRMVNELQFKSRHWIGLTRMSWVWSDRSEPSFTPWRPQEPLIYGLGDCAALVVNSQPLGMTDLDCATKLPFFCYTDPLRKHRVRLKLTADDSSPDMTDPAVMESVLKWVEKKLSDEGVTKDVKLRLTKLPEKKENTKQEQTETLQQVCVP